MTKEMVRGACLMMAAMGVFAAGCGSTATTPPKDKDAAKDKTQNKDAAKDVAKKDKAGPDDHSGWWCKDHGIPEFECSMCSDDFAKACKAKGDWCKEHERAMSQCFHCKPERRIVYAAKYNEKFEGQPPPPIPEFDKKKDK